MTDWSWIEDIAVPGFTAMLGVAGTLLTIHSRTSNEKAQRDMQQANAVMSTQAVRDQAQMTLDASTAQTLTERFKALMDGYENRIDDLSRDNREHRDRLRVLEAEFAARKAICDDCETYRSHLKVPHASPTA